uniref:Uncharacterized protein n=1 Tax=Panagrolaimus sp. ES5 TaxID=591445 RepID=A0AC34FWM5_9BILA
MFIIDEKTHELCDTIKATTVKKLFNSILPMKSKLKFVFVSFKFAQIFDNENDFVLSKVIRDFLNLHSIPNHFCSVEHKMAYNTLIAANISPKINDYFLHVCVDTKIIRVECTCFTVDGHQTIEDRVVESSRYEEWTKSFLTMLKSSEVTKAVLFSPGPDMSMLKKFINVLMSNKDFKFGDKLIVIDYDKILEAEEQAIVEMAKWFFDRSYIKFYILPRIQRPVEIFGVIGDSKMTFITAEYLESIPFKKAIIAAKSIQKICMMEIVEGKVIETLKMDDQKCHQRKVTLKIESECFPELLVESIIIPEIKGLPKKLDKISELSETKIPVIGFFGQSSVICVYKDGGYQFLDSWNGLYGNELFINLEQSKPKYGMDAIKMDKMSSVVYDLIKIMSMPLDEIVVDENWKFVITKDSENPVLIEFDNFEGEKKAATTKLLMAMLIKEQIKCIKNEMGAAEKPVEIGFCFFDTFSEGEKKRVESGIEESCKLLKMSCKFISV